MLNHHIQRAIVYRLAHEPSLRFSELKPDTVDNKLFTYHLKLVVSGGYAVKNENGTYELTPAGRLLGVHVTQSNQDFIERAYSVLFLIVRRREDSAWLLYTRKSHPLLGKVGFMHTVPSTNQTIIESASAALRDKTRLTGTFRVVGSGIFRVFEDDRLESFTNFTLLACENAENELCVNDENAEYHWELAPDFSDSNMLPNMPILVEAYKSGELRFIEKTYYIGNAAA